MKFEFARHGDRTGRCLTAPRRRRVAEKPRLSISAILPAVKGRNKRAIGRLCVGALY